MVLAVGLKQLGVYLLLMAAFIGYATWRFWPDMGPSAPGFDQHEWDAAMAAMRAPLLQMAGFFVAAVLVFLFLRAVVLPWFALWRMGRERRTLTWVVDETGVHRTDALGETNLLPWSNIAKFTTARRVFWLTLRPRGRRCLLRRAFTDADQQRLRELAARMVPG
jgi:hypothetical protein